VEFNEKRTALKDLEEAESRVADVLNVVAHSRGDVTCRRESHR